MEQHNYMRSLITRPSMTDADAKMTPLETAMSTIGEAERKLITARFADLVKACDEMKTQLVDAETERDKATTALKAASNAPATEMLEKQIKMMAEQLNPEIRSTYYCDADTLIGELTSDHPATLLRAADRMLCACNRQMMELRAKPSEPAAEPPRPKRAIAEVEAAEADTSDPIARALAETFTIN